MKSLFRVAAELDNLLGWARLALLLYWRDCTSALGATKTNQ